MALGLFTGSKNIGTNKGNNNAKFAITPHRRNKVMVEQIRKRNNWKQFTSNFKSTYTANVNRRSQSLRTATQ
jgi:hypothetical protein